MRFSHLTTSINYSAPSGVAATPNVTFVYDAAGNRTSMSDGQGSANYVYNNLSQMTSETRSFNGLTPTYTLTYDYNLAGELRSVTNPWNAQVSYGYDKAGRLSNVGGAGYAGVTNYASSLSYRAFGAIKGMNYGDGPNGQGHTLSTAYDSRLRPTTWNVSNVLGYNYAYDYFGEHTGRVTYAHSLTDDTLDRSYEYDLVGRLTVSHSGAEARAHAYSGQWGTLDGPYSQGYDYDVWGNVTHKYGWGGEVQGGTAGQSSDITYNYTGNRRNSFSYDAAGNVTNDITQTFLYDATGQQTYSSGVGGGAGGTAPTFTDDPLNPNGTKTEIKLVHLTELRSAVNALRVRAGLAAVTNWNPDPNPQQYVTPVHHDHITQLRTKLEEALNALHLPVGGYAHSGPNYLDPIYAIDFQELRQKIKDAWTALNSSGLYQSYDGDGLRVKKTEYGGTTFYLRSSVLGGQVLAEVDAGGNLSRGYVYAGSSLMAVQQGGGVFWSYEDPITKSKRVCDVNGNIVSTVELDPWGADTNRSGNQAFQPRKYTTYDRDGNGSDEAMFRRYNRKHSRFDQPDPYDGSYNASDPQSLNRYAYTQNDPVNFVDPTGLDGDDDPYSGLEFGGTLVTNSSAPRWRGITGFLGTGTEGMLLEDMTGGKEPGGGDPQNSSTIPLGDLKSNLQALLKKGDCEKYTTALLAEAAKQFANPGHLKHINTVMEGYNMISAQGDYVLRQVPFDTVGGDLFNAGMNVNAGSGTVLLVPNRLYRTPTTKDIAYYQADYAWTALHETLHLGKRGWYSDEQLADAAYSVAGLSKPKWNGKGNEVDYFSNLLDQELKKHCPQPQQ